MKKLLLALLALLCVQSVCLASFREHRYDSFKVLEPEEGSIIFMGNSITDMHCWHEVFRTSDGKTLPIINRGNWSTCTDEQSDVLESYLRNKPKKVFMLLGTNDIASDRLNLTPEQLIAYLNSVVQRILLRSPETKIYLNSIFPTNSSVRPESKILATNECIKAYADQHDNVTYIDMYDKLKGISSGGVWSFDGLHLAAAATKVWSENLCKYLQEGENFTVSSIYPQNTSSVQVGSGLSGSYGMRATYFSMMPIMADDVLIFGDEHIKAGEWHELLGNLHVKNRGTGWGYGGNISTTSAGIEANFANTGVSKVDPKAIVVYTGSSDCTGSTAMSTVQSQYKAMVDKIQQKAPTSKIYLMGLCPIHNSSTNTSRFAVLNNYIKSLCDGDKIKYIDAYTPMLSGNTANSKYIYSDNFLKGMGYVKMANLIADALKADFPNDTYTVISEAEAEERYAQGELRNSITKAIAAGMISAKGTGVGEYDSAKMQAFDAEVANANILLAKDKLTQAEVDAQVARLKEAFTKAMVLPLSSTEGDEHWYEITTLRSPTLSFTASSATGGVSGVSGMTYRASAMWKFVERGDGTYDIVNREYNTYFDPATEYSAQINTTTTRPSKGWTVSYANTPGYCILTSGEVEVNQTGSNYDYAIKNWSSSANKGNDRSDTGCQVKIAESPATLEYLINKTYGNLYRGDAVNQSWNSVWKSNFTRPQLQFGCGGVNNMNWVDNNLQLMTGTAGSATYTLTPPEGYVIESYNLTFINNSHSTALVLTMGDGTTYTTSNKNQKLNASGQRLYSLTFTLEGPNGNGLLLKDFTIRLAEGHAERPLVSTEGDEHWYYITSSSAHTYCTEKTIYYDAEQSRLRFGNRAFRAEYLWSFWEKDGKLAIKNYRGQYFGTAGSGTGGSTQFGIVDTPNYIYTIEDSYGTFIIKDSGTELHAQQNGQLIVRWPSSEAGNASLWRFDEVDVSNAQATLGSTLVEQGKVTTGIGNKDQAIIRATLRVIGLEGSIKLESVRGMLVGDRGDVTNVKAYFATNERELFIDSEDRKMPWREENGEFYGQTSSISGSKAFTITGDKDLTPGDYYLWIAYDIADDAEEGNQIDARIVNYTIDGEKITEEDGNPDGKATIFLSEGTVLMPMDKGSLYYRIPAITVTKDGKRLVTLTDDRKNHNADLPSHCYLVAQYSDDNGRTWSDPQTVAGTAELGGNYGHGDASIVTNRDNGDIIGIMTSAGTYGHGFFAGTAAEPPRWKTIISHDGGLTWDAPVDHTDDLYGANCDNDKTKTWKSGFSASGAALQKRDGTLVSSFVNRQADDSQHFYFFMSKDGGNSWYVSGNSGTSGADEPKTLERNNGDLAISVRAGGYNYYNYTSDDGETWQLPSQTRFTSGITGNACNGEYMVWCSTLEGNPWDIAFQTLPNSSSRQNVSIALSTDEGATFGTPKTICPRGSAYSAAVVLPDGTLGVYYEENGLFGGYTMRFVRFSLDWASGGKYQFTDDAPFCPIRSSSDIDEVVPSPTPSAALYDLQGRRVEHPTTGIYIKGGNKIIVN